MRLTWGDDAIEVDGRTAATFAQEWFRDRAEVRIGDETWRFRKEGFGGDWAAELGGVDRIAATSTSWWRMRWEIRAPSGTYELRRTSSFLSATFELVAAGAVVGTIESSGLWRYAPQLTVSDGMPVAEAAFVMWLVRRAVARANAAAAAAT